jgi:hypothetical protein
MGMEMEDERCKIQSDYGFVPTFGPPNPQDEPHRLQTGENQHANDIHSAWEIDTLADDCARKIRSPALTRASMTLAME